MSRTKTQPWSPAQAREQLAGEAQQFQSARQQLAEATDRARAAARRAYAEAELSKVEIARMFGIERPTLDRWLIPEGDTTPPFTPAVGGRATPRARKARS
ncbi:hypothetical protein OS121_29640 [Mycolicibacterium mucogenicum]|uniref:hypothetical protein n=1 Tax=Mycolicibacterium mucogenicum TaxID=56689 RepID=UPI0022698FCB|nr:hypothetical protein [Mycolicibacterium mucogenicum]MCX8559212.1 hypothetical protein [Mycolicibacterium mucogenicum]